MVLFLESKVFFSLSVVWLMSCLGVEGLPGRVRVVRVPAFRGDTSLSNDRIHRNKILVRIVEILNQKYDIRQKLMSDLEPMSKKKPRRIINKITPVNLGRLHGESDGRDSGSPVLDSLEAMNNRTMVNVIRQLSSLTEAAHNIFQSLEKLSDNIQERVTSLKFRMDGLEISLESMKVKKRKERQGFQNLMLRDQAWSSSYDTSLGLFTRESRPKYFQSLYDTNCDPLPNFDLLEAYKSSEDDVHCSKKYSDPEFFFWTWRLTMLGEAAQTIHDGGASVVHSRKGKDRNVVPRAIVTTRDMILKRELQAGNVALLQVPQQPFPGGEDLEPGHSPVPTPPPPLRTPDIPEHEQEEAFYFNTRTVSVESVEYKSHETELPNPPPLPPPLDFGPEPPLPPPPPPVPAIDLAPPPSIVQPSPVDGILSVTLKPVEPMEKNICPRDDLLQQIQAGKKLRKTNFDAPTSKPSQNNFDNVEDIFAHVLEIRRDAVMDDSSSDEEYFQF